MTTVAVVGGLVVLLLGGCALFAALAAALADRDAEHFKP